MYNRPCRGRVIHIRIACFGYRGTAHRADLEQILKWIITLRTCLRSLLFCSNELLEIGVLALICKKF
jgi:hypothetical protein